MAIFQKNYKRDEFIRFLEKIHIGENVISKFKELPEKIKKNNSEFDLYINLIWHGEGKTHYEFELNYYSEKLIEYLFSSKVFTDVEYSINYLLCEIKNANCPHKR